MDIDFGKNRCMSLVIVKEGRENLKSAILKNSISISTINIKYSLSMLSMVLITYQLP